MTTRTITPIALDSLDAAVGGAKPAPSIGQPRSQDSWVADATHIAKNIGGAINPFEAPDRIRRGVDGYREGGSDYSFGDRVATGVSRFSGPDRNRNWNRNRNDSHGSFQPARSRPVGRPPLRGRGGQTRSPGSATESTRTTKPRVSAESPRPQERAWRETVQGGGVRRSRR